MIYCVKLLALKTTEHFPHDATMSRGKFVDQLNKDFFISRRYLLEHNMLTDVDECTERL